MKCDCWKESYTGDGQCSCGRYPTFEQKKSQWDKMKHKNYLHSMRLDGIITRKQVENKLKTD